MAMKRVVAAAVSADAQAHEDAHVHAVYDCIAPHFASTRYKPWPIIAAFLASLPTGWVGLDSGTGNGKYLPLPLDRPRGSTWTIGLDRSRNLLDIARTAGVESGAETLREVVWGDVLGKGWRDGAFDYAISIATIHHLATHERRRIAVQRLLQCVSPIQGRVLIYVWAIEQDELSKRALPVHSPELVATTGISSNEIVESPSPAPEQGQDVFVPWVLTSPQAPKPKPKAKRRRDREDAETEPQPPISSSPARDDVQEPRVFNRYYHMFARGELLQLVHEAAQQLDLQVGEPPMQDGGQITKVQGLEVVQNGWERSNYYVELRRWSR